MLFLSLVKYQLWCRGRDGHSKEGHTLFKSQRPLQEICDKIYDQVLKSFTTLFFYKFLRPLNSSNINDPSLNRMSQCTCTLQVWERVCVEKKNPKRSTTPLAFVDWRDLIALTILWICSWTDRVHDGFDIYRQTCMGNT